MKSLFISETITRVAEKPSFTAFLQCLPVSVGGILALVNFTEGKKSLWTGRYACFILHCSLKMNSVSLVTRHSCSELVHLQVLWQQKKLWICRNWRPNENLIRSFGASPDNVGLLPAACFQWLSSSLSSYHFVLLFVPIFSQDFTWKKNRSWKDGWFGRGRGVGIGQIS